MPPEEPPEEPPDEPLPEEELPEEPLPAEAAALSTSFPPLPSQEVHIPVSLQIEHFFPNRTLAPLQYGHTPEAAH